MPKEYNWYEKARKEMKKVSNHCTELTCIYHGKKNREIYERYKKEYEEKK